MRPSGTVYQASGDFVSGELKVSLSESEKKRFKFVQMLGANISSLALAFLVFFYGPNFELDMDYQAGLANAEYKNAGETVMSQYSKEGEQIVAKTDEFAISIPAIGASATVVENVNPFDEPVYLEALKNGVAHANTSSVPGSGKRVFLFAHSTSSPLYFNEYNAVFYQLRLLTQGENIYIRYNGGTYIYRVTDKVIVDASDSHWLTETGSEEELVLQTCDPPGTSIRRLLVIARPVETL